MLNMRKYILYVVKAHSYYAPVHNGNTWILVYDFISRTVLLSTLQFKVLSSRFCPLIFVEIEKL